MFKSFLLLSASVWALSGTTAAATSFIYTGAVQTYTVATTGIYDVVAAGARGGGLGNHGEAYGGSGIAIGAHVALTAGTVLDVIVGGTGGVNYGRSGGGGEGAGFFTGTGSGGGGSFILNTDFSPVVIGGGGGGGVHDYFGHYGGSVRGDDAVAGTAGTGRLYETGAGGTGGLGGQGGGQFPLNQNPSGTYRRCCDGGGGGGLLGAGGTGPNAPAGNHTAYSGVGGSGAPSFAGGAGTTAAGVLGPVGKYLSGGFGGGGGATEYAGGGGGGFSGGGGGDAQMRGAGGGGGSFTQADATDITAIANPGANGFASIDFLSALPPVSALPEPDTWGLMLGGLGLIGAAVRRAKRAARIA